MPPVRRRDSLSRDDLYPDGSHERDETVCINKKMGSATYGFIDYVFFITGKGMREER